MNYTRLKVHGMKRNDVGIDIYKMVTIERRGREDGKTIDGATLWPNRRAGHNKY